MSIKISLSFDDGRIDFFTRAYPLLVKYGLPATLNVITDYVDNPSKYSFKSCRNGSVSWEEIKICRENGIEIAAHGHMHQNTKEDIIACTERLKEMLGDAVYGFASPQSFYNKSNCYILEELLDNRMIKYARSGIQTRREGIFYAALTYLERKTHSKNLFYWLNKRCIIRKERHTIVLSVSVTNTTTVNQINYLINQLKNGESLIFNFHSILNAQDNGYGCGDWYWDSDRFETLCQCLTENKAVEVLSTSDLMEDVNV